MWELEDELDFEMDYEGGWDDEQDFESADELELAYELLSAGSEQELDYFFGKLVKRAGKFLKSKTGRMVTGALKGIAKKALPTVGAAVGNMVAPGIGGAIGGKLGSFASSLFEMELEGLSPEDAELETAKKIVQLAKVAAKNAEQLQRSAPAPQAAKQSVKMALAQINRRGGGTGGQSGRWYRKGNRIILQNVYGG